MSNVMHYNQPLHLYVNVERSHIYDSMPTNIMSADRYVGEVPCLDTREKLNYLRTRARAQVAELPKPLKTAWKSCKHS